MNCKKYTNLCKCIAFCLILSLTLGVLWNVLKGKWLHGSYVMERFYEQPENSVDVIFIGSSHVGADINPAILWEQYGIASYNLWGAAQPLWNSYYYLKECLKYQSPELIVLEVYSAVATEEYLTEDAQIATNTFGMKFSTDKLNAIVTSCPIEKRTDFLLQFPIWHTRYGEITKDDFLIYGDYAQGCNYKGFYDELGFKTWVMDALPDVSGIDEIGEMTDKNYEYLIKIIKMAREKNIPIMLIKSPHPGITAEHKKIYNQIEIVAEEYGIHFIEFNEKMGEIGLDCTHDFAEGTHLNLSGAEKYTSYLGRLVKENYAISDRRGLSGYESWDANANYYRTVKEKILNGK